MYNFVLKFGKTDDTLVTDTNVTPNFAFVNTLQGGTPMEITHSTTLQTLAEQYGADYLLPGGQHFSAENRTMTLQQLHEKIWKKGCSA